MYKPPFKLVKKLLKPENLFPKNQHLPVLVYKNAFTFSNKKHSDTIKEIYLSNGWYKPWVDSIFDFNHYHSNNHEVLGIAKGKCTLILGGDNGWEVELETGDAIILPAGTSHRRIDKTAELKVVGAYSINKEYNMKYGKTEKEAKDSLSTIASLPVPESDPIFGEDGPLIKHWH